MLSIPGPNPLLATLINPLFTLSSAVVQPVRLDPYSTAGP